MRASNIITALAYMITMKKSGVTILNLSDCHHCDFPALNFCRARDSVDECEHVVHQLKPPEAFSFSISSSRLDSNSESGAEQSCDASKSDEVEKKESKRKRKIRDGKIGE